MTLFQNPQGAAPAAFPGASSGRGAPSLRPYQIASLDAIVAAQAKGNNRLLIKKPTGTGKTVTFAAMLQHPPLRAWLEQFPKGERKMLVIAHREELLDQAQDKISKANPGLIVSIEQGERHASRYSDVVIASIQTLQAMKFRRLKRLLTHHKFRIVIVDEAHHSAAPSYRTALVHLGFLPPAEASDVENIEAADFDDVVEMEKALQNWDARAPKDRLLVGVTATPNRSDAIGLGCVFQTIAYSYNLKDAIGDGWLVPILPWVIETESSLDDVRTTAGDFNQKDLAEAVNNAQRNELAVAAWREHAEGLSTIAFTVDVAHAHALAERFQKDGIRAAAISGETPKDDRRVMLRQFSEGQLDVLSNCMVLTEGTDLPRTSCILHAKPTKSATLYEQMTGRGLRLFPGKSECVVIDLVDVARRHSLQASPVLYGLPPGLLVKGKTLEQAAEELELFRQQNPNIDLDELLARGRFSLADLKAKASTFDVWTVPELGDFGQGRSLVWLRLGAEKYRVSYPWADGTEMLDVGKDLLGKWEVVCTMRPHGDGAFRPPARQRTLATGIDELEKAAIFAEEFVAQQRGAVAKLRSKDAPWRGRPASPKQLALLARKKIPHNPKKITMGEASDLIDLMVARRGR